MSSSKWNKGIWTHLVWKWNKWLLRQVILCTLEVKLEVNWFSTFLLTVRHKNCTSVAVNKTNTAYNPFMPWHANNESCHFKSARNQSTSNPRTPVPLYLKAIKTSPKRNWKNLYLNKDSACKICLSQVFWLQEQLVHTDLIRYSEDWTKH